MTMVITADDIRKARDMLVAMDYEERPKLFILYGSQTGTGEDLAERVGREAILNGFQPHLSPMDNFNFANLRNSELACLIASTTGQGVEPDNMKAFWKSLLKRNLPGDYLSKMSFTLLGLGDSSYVKFNFVAKKLFKRLTQLGATALTELFLADDQHDLGPDAVIDQWLPTFWKSVGNLLGLDFKIGASELLRPKFSLKKDISSESKDISHLPPTTVWKCELIKNPRVTASDHFQDVRLISIDLTGTGLRYDPGDVLSVQPSNSDENVKDFFTLFPHLVKEQEENFYPIPNYVWATIPRELAQLYPLPWTLSHLVRHYFDLQSIPKRYFFELLAQFTTCPIEREKLEEFASAAGQQDLYSYCNRPKRNVLEVLQDFPHATVNIPTDYLFDLIRPIKPRSFSIASSMAALGNELQILVAVVNYKTKLKKPRLGLCSNWLANLHPGELIPVWIERGSFHFPSPDEKRPVIMVGPGTGCAPFRSFISERVGTLNDLTLFFGCRFRQKDFYFQDEWTLLQTEEKLRLFLAFSREVPDSGRVYVQHKIEEYGQLLWDLIEKQGGLIYVAGNAKRMPIDVSEAFVSIFRQNGCPLPENYLKDLVKLNRYQTEVWS